MAHSRCLMNERMHDASLPAGEQDLPRAVQVQATKSWLWLPVLPFSRRMWSPGLQALVSPSTVPGFSSRTQKAGENRSDRNSGKGSLCWVGKGSPVVWGPGGIWRLRSGPSKENLLPLPQGSWLLVTQSLPGACLRISKQLTVSVWAARPDPGTKPMFPSPRIPTGTSLELEDLGNLHPDVDSGFSLWTSMKSKAVPWAFSSIERGQWR